MGAARVTVTLDEGLLMQAREAGNGNFSRFVAEAVEERLDRLRREKLRAALIAGYAEKADEDLAICREWDAAPGRGPA